MNSTDEQSLVLRAQQGDPVAFRDLISLHEQKAYNLALWLLGPGAAEAAAMAAMEQVFGHLSRFRGEMSFAAWVLRAVTSTCLNAMQRPGHTRPGVGVSGSLPLILSQMVPEERAVIVLCDVLGCSYQDLADILDCPPAAVRSRVSEARMALRSHLQTQRNVGLRTAASK